MSVRYNGPWSARERERAYRRVLRRIRDNVHGVGYGHKQLLHKGGKP